ncbi:IS1595 family transposase [Ferrovibrio sp.]|uniref:IS1595 family transposase n=1 Tax=Ferrovibrio sp. TaxID=1917215 RepID=UPI0025BD0997|nr:IS1595 family transposase [Ferrovibrio sp.]MBX3455869.1 IS1595 family transposase [Ferrovibrio sp.]
MSKSILDSKLFHDEAAAYRFVEAKVWPNGPVCPHCKADKDKVGALKGNSTRHGVYKCYGCRKPFTVKVGTIFEASHVKMNLWLQAIYLMCSSKKGISSNQLHRTLGVTLKTAWFMSHRIREAMKVDTASEGPLGGEGQTVEADETFWGPGRAIFETGKGWVGERGTGGKMKVLTVVERKGRARSLVAKSLPAKKAQEFIGQNVDAESRLVSDEAPMYPRIGKGFAGHETVNHSQLEYARGDVTTNTVEGFFSVFKRGMRGTYQHCGEQHLQRYLAEFDFRYSNRKSLGVDDVLRTEAAVKGVVGKRLTYRTTSQRA